MPLHLWFETANGRDKVWLFFFAFKNTPTVIYSQIRSGC